MEDKVKQILATVLNISASDINESSSSDTLESWESLAHLNLIAALEEEFDVEFDEDEILSLTSYQAIVDRLKK